MYQLIQRLIHDPQIHKLTTNEAKLYNTIDALGKRAFVEKHEESLLSVHRILYVINLAHLAPAWEMQTINTSHPVIARIKYQLERYWEIAEREKYSHVLQVLPPTAIFPQWVRQEVQDHPSNQLHPIFIFLRDKANFEQMREFMFQETPLEMLFGDLLAFMLPGVYGSIKIEILKNYWDEVGHAKDARIHRNLRANLMNAIQLETDCYLTQYESLVREELELINMYLGLAINRSKQTELVGVILATELMIPNRFQYSIDGWRRLGMDDNALTYLIEHTSLDEVHSEDWLIHVVMPMMKLNPQAMTDIVLGIYRRLNTAVAVLDRLYLKLTAMNASSVGTYQHEPFYFY